jgi:hypothetical protein
MLPIGRLRDLMPKTVKDAVPEIVNRNGTLDSCRFSNAGLTIMEVHHVPAGVLKDPETESVTSAPTGRMRPHDRHAPAAMGRANIRVSREAQGSGSRSPSP